MVDYCEGLICFGDRLFICIWNKIYNGISVGYVDCICELVVNGYEIIYVLCYCSYMDYLLLIYVIYYEGMVMLYIVVGINLNFWLVGKMFCCGGVFFLCCSFVGNKFYIVVFREYLELLFNKGYLVKYYFEGGCSWIGCLILLKMGMLVMII